MNLPCLIGMIICAPVPETSDKMVRSEMHAEVIPRGDQLIAELGSLDVK